MLSGREEVDDAEVGFVSQVDYESLGLTSYLHTDTSWTITQSQKYEHKEISLELNLTRVHVTRTIELLYLILM